MGRGVAARVGAALLALFWGGLFFGLIDLAVVFEGTPGFFESYLLETGWGILYSVLVAAPLVGLAIRPGRASLTTQLLVVGLCVGLAGIAASSWVQLWPAAGLLLTAVVVTRLGGTRLSALADELSFRWRRPERPVLLVVACLAIPPFVLVGTDLVVGFRQGLPPTDDDTWFVDHWPMQAALALALPSVSVLASFLPSGWRFSLWTVGVSAAWWGAVSVSYPDHAGSLGTFGGWASIVWAIALLASQVPGARPHQIPEAPGR